MKKKIINRKNEWNKKKRKEKKEGIKSGTEGRVNKEW